MRERKLVSRCMSSLEMIDRLEKLRIIPECTSYGAQATDVLGMIPSRVVAAAIRVRDECDPRSALRRRYLTGLRLRRDNRSVEPSLIPDSASPSDSFRISNPLTFTTNSAGETPSG